MIEPPRFPRADDGAGWAWGLEGDTPRAVWERFSPAYEALAERLLRAIAARGLTATLEGAGSEDGEFILVHDLVPGGVPEGYELMCHLEDPNEAVPLAALDAAGIEAWIDEILAGRGPGAGAGSASDAGSGPAG